MPEQSKRNWISFFEGNATSNKPEEEEKRRAVEKEQTISEGKSERTKQRQHEQS
jgi:hypothetical protein